MIALLLLACAESVCITVEVRDDRPVFVFASDEPIAVTGDGPVEICVADGEALRFAAAPSHDFMP